MNFRIVEEFLPEARQQGWRVILRGREIDKVFMSPDMDADEVKYSLINHDNYDNRIVVIKEGAEEHERFKDPAKNPFNKVLTKHGFQCVSVKHQQNYLARNNPKADYTEFIYTHPAHGKSHVLIWLYHGDGSKTFIFRHEQTNGIMAPSTGDTKGQLDRCLTREYGEPK